MQSWVERWNQVRPLLNSTYQSCYILIKCFPLRTDYFIKPPPPQEKTPDATQRFQTLWTRLELAENLISPGIAGINVFISCFLTACMVGGACLFTKFIWYHEEGEYVVTNDIVGQLELVMFQKWKFESSSGAIDNGSANNFSRYLHNNPIVYRCQSCMLWRTRAWFRPEWCKSCTFSRHIGTENGNSFHLNCHHKIKSNWSRIPIACPCHNLQWWHTSGSLVRLSYNDVVEFPCM